jgi:hydroxyproline O-arabinosyltransferase
LTETEYHRMIILVSADDSVYQRWQLELLAYTYFQVKQSGSLLYLISTHEKDLPKFAAGVTVLPSRLLSHHPVSGDHYPPYNKPSAICAYLSHVDSSDSQVYLLLDPDMILVRPWFPDLGSGLPVGEYTSYMNPATPAARLIIQRHCRRNQHKIQPIGYPVVIQDHALREISDRWYILTEEMRADSRTRAMAGWVCEMWAFAVASAEVGIGYSMEHNSSFLHDPDLNRPVIHYTYDLTSSSGFYWGKRHYQPWDVLPPLREDLPGSGVIFHRVFSKFLQSRKSEDD